MNRSYIVSYAIGSIIIFSGIAMAEESAENSAENTVILDATGVKNLRIKTLMCEERDFEKTVFAIGRVEDIPGNQYSVSSRISGRAIKVNAFIGDYVEKGKVLVSVESRQPGDPPPVIELKAPHSGLITKAHVLKGQPVEPDQDLFDISDRSRMWIAAQIPEQRAAGIKVGTKARISFPAVGGEPIEAKLLRFGVKADRSAGAVVGIFEVTNKGERLAPGMRAELEIITSVRPNVLAVPESAVQGDPASRVVYIKHVELDNAFVKSPVVLGEKGGGWIEVKQGMFPGDEVVTQGSYSLGFVGGGGGISLKEALDAAHGHEHNEDGSKMTDEQKAVKEGGDDHGHGDGGESGAPGWLIYYAGACTLLLVFFAQLWWNLKRKESTRHAE